MEKKPTETFKLYAQRLRDISAQVEPLLTKTEIIVLFINTIKGSFYDKLVGSTTKDFADIVIFGELIENAIKSGRIEGLEISKRAVPVRKKETETHMVGTESHYTCNPYPAQSRPRYRPPLNFYFSPQGPYCQAPSPYPVYTMNNQRLFTVFPPNTMPTQSQPKNEQRPAKSKNYLPFKRRVQGLINIGILRFDGVSNVAENPLPNHTDGNVNAMTNEDEWRAKSCVAEVRTPLRKVWKMMVEKDLFCPSNRIFKEENTKGQSFCDFHSVEGHDIQYCEEFRKLLQDMIDNKEVKIFDKMEEVEEGKICISDNQPLAILYSADRPLVIYYETKMEEVKPMVIIEVPSLFPYKDNKAVPWKYDVNIVVPKDEKSKAMNEGISGVGHFTRSGRCYSAKMVEPRKKVTNLNQKGKAPMHEVEVDVEMPSEQEVKRPANKEEAYEFLKFIKHSEYSVVKQLNKQPTRISLDRWVSNLNADNFIFFSDDEIPPNGRGSVKVLHITTSCKGYIVPNVLIDNGSALNVMPLDTLSKMPIDMSYLRPCHSTVKAFDGTRWEVIGKIQIPLEVGICAYDIEFQVMDITPSYNFLLERPWIHSTGAVPSSLYQKVKFIMDSRLITVAGEEDIIASISVDAPYIEVSKGTIECSFHSFEFINATFIAKGNKIPTPNLSRNTNMGIKLTVRKGVRVKKGLGRYQQGIARALKPIHHKVLCSLRFEPDIR
ncbi:uncharacterized protein [Gossypium hirsutum]|uniref:Gag-pro-like protein n=1 Tax=Gossypium hirsutum TaxID=3635 RepID=A0ABM3AD82_GOSHI|nr:uncharacterized protein LOC121219190 [Gossypium hirsutum]